MPKSQPGGKGIAGGQRRHAVTADIPRRRRKSANQPSRKNSPSLQSGKTENLPDMSAVVSPVIDNVKNLGAEDPAQHHKNAEVPRIVPIDPLLLRVAHADPQTDQHAQRDEESVGGQTEIANMKESREHC